MKPGFPQGDYQPNEGQNGGGGSSPQVEDADAMELAEGDIAPAEATGFQDEIAALNEKILRIAAELENTRRRADREKADAGRYAIANFARDVLSVADAFERALNLAPTEAAASVESQSAIIEGIRLAENSLMATLERHGVKRINPKGEKFDPALHQAVAQAPGDAPAGFVLDVVQPGFVIGDRTLRAAMVVVSTGPAGATGAHLDTTA